MSDKTPVNRIQDSAWQVPPETDYSAQPENREEKGVRQLMADVVELSELQLQLLASDVKSSFSMAIKPIVWMVVAAIILLGALPVVLLAIASLLESDLVGWSDYIAQGAVSLVALVIGAILLKVSSRALKRCVDPISRSASEMAETVAQLKNVLNRSETASSGETPNRPR